LAQATLAQAILAQGSFHLIREQFSQRAGAAMQVVKATLVVVFFALSVFLQGCGCDEEAAKKCGKEQKTNDCAGMQKSLDCYKEICECEYEENGVKSKVKDQTHKLAAAWTIIIDAWTGVDCKLKDPCK